MNNARVRGQSASRKFSSFIFQISFLLVLCSMLYALPVNAQYGQYGAYGSYGGSSIVDSILVDKMVGTASGTSTKGDKTEINYVDNLTTNDNRFSPESEINFKVKVKNTSNRKLSNITVKDTLPSFVEPIENNGGNYDKNNRVILFNTGELAVGEEKTYIVRVKIVSQNQLPGDQGVICLMNKVAAETNDTKGGQTNLFDEDSAQFCVEKEVLGVKTQPSSGPEFGLGLLGLQLIGLTSGVYLKKRFS